MIGRGDDLKSLALHLCPKDQCCIPATDGGAALVADTLRHQMLDAIVTSDPPMCECFENMEVLDEDRFAD